EGEICGGRGGPHDGYFGTSGGPDAIQFSFVDPISRFGFFGAEARTEAGASNGNDGQFDVEFYGAGGTLLGSVHVDTAGVFAWDQFHGFSSDVPIERVVL